MHAKVPPLDRRLEATAIRVAVMQVHRLEFLVIVVDRLLGTWYAAAITVTGCFRRVIVLVRALVILAAADGRSVLHSSGLEKL